MRFRPVMTLLLVCVFVLLSSFAAQAQDDLTFEGELTNRNPTASFDLPLEAGQVVTITTEADDLDTVLTLLDEDGDTVAENDDRPDGGLTSQVVFAAEEGGTYEIQVSGFADATGEFSVIVTFGADFGLSDEATILVDETVTISGSQEEVSYPITLNVGDILVVTTQGVSADLDTTLALLDAGGATITQNDDRGDGTLNSQIVFEVVTAGEYTVVVSTFNNDSSGDLLLSIATDPNAEAPYNYASIQGEDLASYEGEITDDAETADFPVELNAGDTLLALLDTVSGDLDPVLTLLDPEGFVIAINDDRADGSLNSAIAYTVNAAGTYTVRVERFRSGGSTGEFDLVLKLVDASVVAELVALADDAVDLTGDELIVETANFRIHYTLEGDDATTEAFVQEVAETVEVIYDVQINQIGWAEPPRNSDGLYDVYIAELLSGPDGVFGYARSVLVVADNPNTEAREQRAARAVLVIDNDYTDSGLDSSPDSLMRATVTHEFNHIVQYGYDSLEGLGWMYESTASWTETTTVGDEQAATIYVADDYQYPELCYTTLEQDGYLDYGQWTFLQSLADQYGEDFVVGMWENTVEYDGLEVFSLALEAEGSTIPEAVARWRIQNFARAYDLAPLFGATVWLENTIDDTGDWSFNGEGIQALGANYYELDLDGVYLFKLDGTESLQLWALGVTGDQVEAIPLGNEGTFDTSGYDYAGLMVFDSAVPSEPGNCSYSDYEIAVSEGRANANGAPTITFTAENFEPLQSGD
jgi:hypothetical protein